MQYCRWPLDIFEANAKHLCHIQVKITVRFMPTCITSCVVAAEPDLGLDGHVWSYETQELLPLIQYFCSARGFFCLCVAMCVGFCLFAFLRKALTATCQPVILWFSGLHDVLCNSFLLEKHCFWWERKQTA